MWQQKYQVVSYCCLPIAIRQICCLFHSSTSILLLGARDAPITILLRSLFNLWIFISTDSYFSAIDTFLLVLVTLNCGCSNSKTFRMIKTKSNMLYIKFISQI